MFQKLAVSTDQIVAIEKLTHGQHTNKFWTAFRCGRLTVSNFGLVLRACRRNSYPPSPSSLSTTCRAWQLYAGDWVMNRKPSMTTSEICVLSLCLKSASFFIHLECWLHLRTV